MRSPRKFKDMESPSLFTNSIDMRDTFQWCRHDLPDARKYTNVPSDSHSPMRSFY